MGTILQLSGLALVILAGALISIPAAIAAVALVAVFVGIAAERD